VTRPRSSDSQRHGRAWCGVAPDSRAARRGGQLRNPLPASELEREILPARVEGYEPSDLDRLLAAGEARSELGERMDASLSTDRHLRLLRSDAVMPSRERSEQRIVTHLGSSGASFFGTARGHRGGFRR
jgi:ATP-dependent Lhr-like helicase